MISRNDLTEYEANILGEFISDRDRGAAKTFVGRKTELGELKSRLMRVESRGQDPSFVHAPAADMTMVFQGAPGVGKSAVLAKIAEDWALGKKGRPCAINVDPGLLKLPMDSLVSTLSRNLTRRTNGVARNLLDLVQSVTAGIPGLGSVELNLADLPSPGSSLAPVVLLFDEIQSVLGAAMPPEAQSNLRDNLRQLHTGAHGLPVFPVFGGLANSGDLLRESGLTRLSSESEFTLARFSDETSIELVEKFADTYLTSARPADGTVGQWKTALVRDCQGWPMHCRNFLYAVAVQIRDCGWRPEDVDLDKVRLKAAGLRARYYSHRLAGLLTDRQGLVSVVLERLKRNGPMEKESIVRLIRDADQKGRSSEFDGDHRWALPEGADFRQVFDVMLHSGIVQYAGWRRYDCPIPSLGSYMAAMSARPSQRLHGAVMFGEPDAVESEISYAPSQEERSKLLAAVDIRGRTPLALAIEAGFYPLAQRLVDMEENLPENLRSFGVPDAVGKRACERAAASDDRRIQILADSMRPTHSA